MLLGTFSGAVVNSSFPDDPAELYNPEFLENFRNDGAELKAVLLENNIVDWDIQSPTVILHGQSDNVVPFFNSVQLTERNEGKSFVMFRELMSPDHFQGIFEWGLITMDYFDGF